MENKCFEHNTCGGNVYINMNKCCGAGEDIMSCACIPSLKITIGEGGQFATLTEALEHAKTIVHNSLEIEMLSDVIETRTTGIWVDRFVETMPMAYKLEGNGHTLNLNSITDKYALGANVDGRVLIHNVTILAQNITVSALAIGTNSFMYLYEGVKLVGSNAVNRRGITAYLGGYLRIAYGKNVIENSNIGIAASDTARVCIESNAMSFVNVTTNYSPAPNTVGNSNAYIHVQ